MKINNGTHKIFFSMGKLYLDGVQIAGEGILPLKDVMFEFQVNKPEEVEIKSNLKKDPSVLEINVFDEIPIKDVGPGQK